MIILNLNIIKLILFKQFFLVKKYKNLYFCLYSLLFSILFILLLFILLLFYYFFLSYIYLSFYYLMIFKFISIKTNFCLVSCLDIKSPKENYALVYFPIIKTSFYQSKYLREQVVLDCLGELFVLFLA